MYSPLYCSSGLLTHMWLFMENSSLFSAPPSPADACQCCFVHRIHSCRSLVFNSSFMYGTWAALLTRRAYELGRWGVFKPRESQRSETAGVELPLQPLIPALGHGTTTAKLRGPRAVSEVKPHRTWGSSPCNQSIINNPHSANRERSPPPNPISLPKVHRVLVHIE